MIDVRIVHIHDFIKTTPVGALDLESSKELLFKVAREQTGDCCHMLLDIRHAITNVSYREIYELVRAMKEEEDLFQQKIALLDNYDDAFEHAQFFEASAQHAGLQVKAFIDFEEAFRWLYPETTMLDSRREVQKVKRET
ncbi:MAG TPA: hypothetical protein VKP65_00810 [Rhodothermales bacterium]|nr:hypothetical protein [Rhodothermales bacterium]